MDLWRFNIYCLISSNLPWGKLWETNIDVKKPMVSLWFPWMTEVIKQGEPGTSFFVIAQGELEVFIKDAQGEEKRARDLRDPRDLSWSGTHREDMDGKRWLAFETSNSFNKHLVKF